MSKQRIFFTPSFRLIADAVRMYNEKHSVDVVLPDGTHKKKYNLTKILRQPHVNLIQQLVKLYASHLNKVQMVSAGDTIPPLKTNNEQLGTLIGVSGRTIQRWLPRLIEARFIKKGLRQGTDEERAMWHGTNSSYELIINPALLSMQEQIDPKEITERIARVIHAEALKQMDLATKKTSCPHTETGTKEINQCSVVDNAGSAAVSDLEKITGDLTGDMEAQQSERKKEKKEMEATQSAQEQLPAGYVPAAGAHVPAEIARYVMRLWNFAFNNFYSKLPFLFDSEIEFAKAYFVSRFLQVKPDDYLSLYMEFVTRLIMVEKYVAKSTIQNRKFVPLPSSYFNPENKRGFEGTALWYERSRYTQKQIKQFAERCENENKLYAAFKDGVKTYFNKQDFNSFRSAEQRIGKFKNEKALRVFYSLVVDFNK